MILAVLPADVPVVIDRDDAQRAAAEELAKPEYHAAEPGLAQRILAQVGHWLAGVFQAASDAVPGGPLGLLVLLAVLVLIAVVVRLRVGKFARTVRASGVVFERTVWTARDHRRAAAEAFAAGDHESAVRERFRALVRALEERGVLDVMSGRTADEAAREAGVRLPSARTGLTAAARLFDDVHYGDRPATAEDYHRLAALDEQVSRQRPEVPV